MEQGITDRLLAHAGLAALVDNRIQWDLRPQANGLPAVTLRVVSGVPVQSDEGDSGLTNTRLQIDCWAIGSTVAKDVGTQVLDALSAVEMVEAGTEYQAIYRDNVQDFTEQGQGGVVIYRRMLDFDIWHTE